MKWQRQHDMLEIDVKVEEELIILKSEITCPHCGYEKMETMPVDSCECYYDCESCSELLEPRVGECCVYCSYGSVDCPATQEGKENRSC